MPLLALCCGKNQTGLILPRKKIRSNFSRISIILIIAIVFTAFVFIYNIITLDIRESSRNIQTETLTADLKINYAKVFIPTEEQENSFLAITGKELQLKEAEVLVERLPGDANIIKIKFICDVLRCPKGLP